MRTLTKYHILYWLENQSKLNNMRQGAMFLGIIYWTHTIAQLSAHLVSIALSQQRAVFIGSPGGLQWVRLLLRLVKDPMMQWLRYNKLWLWCQYYYSWYKDKAMMWNLSCGICCMPQLIKKGCSHCTDFTWEERNIWRFGTQGCQYLIN